MVKSSKITRFWAIFFAVLSVLAISVGVFYYIMLTETISRQKATVVENDNIYRMQLDNMATENLYYTMESLDNISTNIHRIAISSDRQMHHKLAEQIAIDASNLVVCFEHLPIVNGDKHADMKVLANRLYGYSLSLTDKLSEGEQLGAEDSQALLQIKPTVDELSIAISSIISEYGNTVYTDSLRSDNSNAIDDNLTKVNIDKDSFDYMGLYATMEGTSIKLGDKLTEEELITPTNTFLHDMHCIDEANLTVMTSDDQCIIMTIDNEHCNGEVVITLDGRIVEVNLTGEYAPCNIKDEEACKTAEDYCKQLGYDVEHIAKVERSGSRSYIMLAPRVEGGIVASDTITVALVGNEVVAFNCGNYIRNHRDRTVEWGELTRDDAAKSINYGKVMDSDRVIVDVDGKQYCCHMLLINADNKMYSTYVDSVTGRHVRMDAMMHGAE